MGQEKNRFETKVIHEGYNTNEFAGSLAPPIFQTSTFTFETAEQGEKRFAGEEAGYVYSRLGNPTVTMFEQRMAQLEGGEMALGFASGMAAVSAVLMSLTKSDDHILCSQGVYGCTYGLLELFKEKYNINFDFSAMSSEEELRAAITEKTTCIYVETPINPTMQIIDLKMVAKVANEYSIPVVVDNTFCSPYLQRPLELGCDIVVHSATKYLCGHGDVIAGVAVGTKEMMEEVSFTTRKDVGGVLAPFNAWLLLRGLKTLPVRMDRHCDNAVQIATYLQKHPYVEKVVYPGFGMQDNEQMKKGGGMISFTIKGDKKKAQEFMNKLELIKIAVSLGDAETLIQHPATMTHAVVPEQRREEMGITNNMLRLSVGLEAWEDIQMDLEQALDQMQL
ncbi:methionine gamma-lyase [Alkalihalobacillus sp. LMS39]|uniref:methionine gamma-lyase n=1 Tax=Alkalihalobacillus sp. LMS39 TaxID=2924032 RepID=UPI001FB274B0|nr:methionine gamma-lyase [Alkalihalobacillus sp. LMS39]UOE96182.1 methionine gamma-lyase [Alkalihalobacillus sp. LMS39]